MIDFGTSHREAVTCEGKRDLREAQIFALLGISAAIKDLANARNRVALALETLNTPSARAARVNRDRLRELHGTDHRESQPTQR